MDYDCNHNKDMFLKMSDQLMLNTSFSWLIWSRSAYSDLEGMNLNMDSEVTWATGEAGFTVSLHDLYKINFSWSAVSTPAGKWDNTTGLHYNLSEYKYLRRADLQGLLFNAALVMKDIPTANTASSLTSEDDRHIDCKARYNYALYRRLAEKFNFTMQLQVADSDDAMLRMLQRGDAQLAINSLIMSSQRLDAIDFTGATWKFRPFTKRVWLTVLTSWMLMTIAIQLVNWLESRRENYSHLNTDHSWGASVITITGAISEQGTELESNWMTWRIIYLVTLVQVVLLNAYYGACLVSDLLQPPPKYILTVHDLMRTKIHIGYVDNKQNKLLCGKIYQSSFAMSDPVTMELYKNKMHSADKSAFPFDIAVEKLHKEHFAIHDDVTSLYPVIERTFNNDEKCAITEIPLFTPRITYTGIQKRSPYKELFIYGFLKMKEKGVMARELSTWRPQPPMCQILDNFHSVKMETVIFAFSIFVCGVTIATFLLLMERFQCTR
ncbi:hypothetical protein L9F63_008632 [Diploptera punctata]|uniref:Ionotropic glutamate receptor C-terminal domain-containing protein n=1 Tax=Diploptera punctata TaxID=6984 RepID=A0AAD8E268_DIPPU|nr:hypothetical protein L9F63_008632 [Diploptera punctata]